MTTRADSPYAPGRLIKLAFLIVFTVGTLFPVLWVFKMALTDSQGFDASINPLPSDPTLANFKHILFETPFFTWLFNSALISIITTVAGVFLACTSAYALSRFRFPGRTTAMLSWVLLWIRFSYLELSPG